VPRNPLTQAAWRAHCRLGQVWPSVTIDEALTQDWVAKTLNDKLDGTVQVPQHFLDYHHRLAGRIHSYGVHRRSRLHQERRQACGTCRSDAN